MEYNTWSCLCDIHADLAWSWPLLLKEGLHGALIADSWQKGTDLIVIYCCRPGDTVLIAPGITHMASNIVITKPLRLVSILVYFLARVLGTGIWN